MASWFDWSSWFGNDEEDDEEDAAEVDVWSGPVNMHPLTKEALELSATVREEIDAGEDEAEETIGLLSGSGSLKEAILRATGKLERLVENYEDEKLSSSSYSPDWFTTEKVYAQRIQTLIAALRDACNKLKRLCDEDQKLEQEMEKGWMSRQEYDDKSRQLSTRAQRTITRLEMAEIGATYDELGEVSDQWNHIFEDAFSDDNGETRQKIAKKLQSMPRRKALAILEQAVRDGIISEETANYLISNYVRTR